MPSHASTDPEIKRLYISGISVMSSSLVKFGIVTIINPNVFLGDVAFDTVPLYKKLLSSDTLGENRHFGEAYIPLNAKLHLENADYTINENGIPCCPHDPSLPMKPKRIFVRIPASSGEKMNGILARIRELYSLHFFRSQHYFTKIRRFLSI